MSDFVVVGGLVISGGIALLLYGRIQRSLLDEAISALPRHAR